MMRILVAGGPGFIGSHLETDCYALRAHSDWHVTNLDKLIYAGCNENRHDVMDKPRHTFVHCDICNAAMAGPLVEVIGIGGTVANMLARCRRLKCAVAIQNIETTIPIDDVPLFISPGCSPKAWIENACLPRVTDITFGRFGVGVVDGLDQFESIRQRLIVGYAGSAPNLSEITRSASTETVIALCRAGDGLHQDAGVERTLPDVSILWASSRFPAALSTPFVADAGVTRVVAMCDVAKSCQEENTEVPSIVRATVATLRSLARDIRSVVEGFSAMIDFALRGTNRRADGPFSCESLNANDTKEERLWGLLTQEAAARWLRTEPKAKGLRMLLAARSRDDHRQYLRAAVGCAASFDGDTSWLGNDQETSDLLAFAQVYETLSVLRQLPPPRVDCDEDTSIWLLIGALSSLHRISIEVEDLGELSACFMRTEYGRSILVNRRLSVRERCEAALHEFGHLQLRHRPGSAWGLSSQGLTDDVRAELDQNEDEADGFAALWIHCARHHLSLQQATTVTESQDSKDLLVQSFKVTSLRV